MLNFAGQNLLCLHDALQREAPKVHAQRTQFAGVTGESQILLGVGGRSLTVDCWLTDASFGTPQALDNYRASLDQSVGTVGQLVESGPVSAVYGDVCFEGFTPSGPVLPVAGVGMPQGTFWQPGTLHFYQLTVP